MLPSFVHRTYICPRGFAAQASTKALETVHALNDQYLPYIEEDSIVSIDGDLIKGGHTN
jgi:hypothetical protein